MAKAAKFTWQGAKAIKAARALPKVGRMRKRTNRIVTAEFQTAVGLSNMGAMWVGSNTLDTNFGGVLGTLESSAWFGDDVSWYDFVPIAGTLSAGNSAIQACF
jgi:hypothetical protein